MYLFLCADRCVHDVVVSAVCCDTHHSISCLDARMPNICIHVQLRGYDHEANIQGQCLLRAASHEIAAAAALEQVLPLKRHVPFRRHSRPPLTSDNPFIRGQGADKERGGKVYARTRKRRSDTFPCKCMCI